MLPPLLPTPIKAFMNALLKLQMEMKSYNPTWNKAIFKFRLSETIETEADLWEHM